MRIRQWTAGACAVLIAGNLTACAPAKQGIETSGTTVSGSTAMNEEQKTEDTDMTSGTLQPLPKEGEVISGFTAKKFGTIDMLGAKTVLFEHENSGAQLLYIQNDDKELAFNIIYRTPYLDETDVNHVFEHAILASSKKYPSKDIFFDIVNKTYNTYINASTAGVTTSYPVASQSQEQLKKLADVYLSCMTGSDFLTNENLFKREAVRYELRNPEDPVTMVGTVFSEDTGYMTDTGNEAIRNTLQALYSGQTAANMVGRANRNYKELTYGHTLELYDRCYSFSNSLMVLYGDMDYKDMLEFVDKEYLADVKKEEKDVLKYFDEPVKEGYEEVIVESPAYEGDQEEDAAVLQYTVDLSDMTWEELYQTEMLAMMMDHDSSSFNKKLRDAGIQNKSSCSTSIADGFARNFFMTELEDANADQMKNLKDITLESLKQIAENGVSPDVYQAVLKEEEVSQYLSRESTSMGVRISSSIGYYWAMTGNTDCYELRKAAFDDIKNDKDQKIVKSIAKRLSEPKTSALVGTVPKAGLAEQIEAEQETYLKDMKDSMSEEQISQMIADTEEFDTWNASELSNSDFMIDPSELPDPEELPKVTASWEGDITCYSSPVDVERVGAFGVLFDTSAVPQEDLHYLALYKMLLEEVDTDKHSREELQNLDTEYLNDMSFSITYPNEDAGEYHYPMLRTFWYGLTEDYAASLDLLLEIMGHSQFYQTEQISDAIATYMSEYDESRGDGMSISMAYAQMYQDPERYYQEMVEGQGFYIFLQEVLKNLESDPAYAETLTEKLQQITKQVVQKDRIITMAAAREDALDGINAVNMEKLNALDIIEDRGEKYDLPLQPKKRVGVIMESSNQNSTTYGLTTSDFEFQGRYLPYLVAANDKYIVPKIRFELGAYGGDANFQIPKNVVYLYSYSDPNVSKSVEALEDTANQIADLDLSDKELAGYVLHAYGVATKPVGKLAQAQIAMNRLLFNIDTRQVNKTIMDIRNATMEDQDAAAASFAEILKHASSVTAGNEAKINGEKDFYEEIINLKE